MPWTVFERLNAEREREEEPLFANPRNAASGTLKSQNSAVVASRKLDAYLYYLLGEELPHDGHYENLQAARAWGFKIPDVIRKCQSLQDIFDYIAYWDVERKNLPVATDGIDDPALGSALSVEFDHCGGLPHLTSFRLFIFFLLLCSQIMIRFAMVLSNATRLSFTCRIRLPAQLADHRDITVHHESQLRQMLPDLIPAGDLADRNSLSRPGHCQRHHKTSLLCKTLLPLGSVLWLAFANLLSVL